MKQAHQNADNTIIRGNWIGNIWERTLFGGYPTAQSDFNNEEVPAGIDVRNSNGYIMENNRVAGVEGISKK